MSIRGKAAAAAAVAGVILLLSGCSSAPAAPTSDQIKASAQARLDASMESGRYAQENIRAVGGTPGDATCQAQWDNLFHSEQHSLLYAMWMHGCVDAPTP
ncbi:hypothetical protein [Streptomyces sp. NPDC047009]|uniref:hypothetical protein n=1 Tax=Streptomyces sp. NPDC047009 TaxID=3154496 RepID=UPI0033C24D05